MDVVGAPPSVVGPYLARALDDPGWERCTVDLIAGGRSNLTYTVTGPPGTVVLRRPPLRAVRPTAHDMAREYRVLTALAGTDVPVPRTLHLCPDTAVLGAPFYVMERVAGIIARPGLPDGYAGDPAQRTAIAHQMVDVLATLHATDPETVGLADFGRPDGFLARQVRRWSTQWEGWQDQPRPALDALGERLRATLPRRSGAAIVHGDYRLDNLVLDADEPGRIAAVLDWEMSTLGDPLTDLGLLVVYWTRSGDRLARPPSVVPAVTTLPGFPSRTEIVDRYAAATGRDVSPLPWYVAFGFFKLAVVVAGIAARERAGAMGSADEQARAVLAAEMIDPLVERGHEVLDTGSLDG